VIAESVGEASRFSQVLAAYEAAPEITRQRLYIEAMESVLGATSKVLIDVDQGNSLMYLPLDKMMSNNGANFTTQSSGTQAPSVRQRIPDTTPSQQRRTKIRGFK
jgi:membrane protease subunit HflK